MSAGGLGVLAAEQGDTRAPRGGTPVREALQGAMTAIAAGGCETPRLDAEVLLADVLGVRRERLLTDASLRVQGQAVRAYQDAVRRRAVEREPVAYIIGRRAFRHIELEVDPRALIPRPETELLVEAGLALAPGAAVLDVCTGSGAVALALKQERPDLEVWGSDISDGALALARGNAERLGLEVGWLHADLLEGVPDRFDAVLANPPYVADSERPALAPEIVRHEPPEALFAGPEGLAVIAPLVDQLGARSGIRTAAIEVGERQAETVARRMREAGFGATSIELDLEGYKACGDREKRKGMIVTLDEEAADRLRDCVTAGGVAVFPSDTVYGVCCDPDNEEAARRLYALKGRPSARACAVMFFALEDALELLDDLHESEREALQSLLPGPVTVLLANRQPALRLRLPGRSLDARPARAGSARRPRGAVDGRRAGAAVERQPVGRARRADARAGARSGCAKAPIW